MHRTNLFNDEWGREWAAKLNETMNAMLERIDAREEITKRGTINNC